MDAAVEQPDIMTALFESCLEDILMTVFLLLEPASLKACRQVKRQWGDFILARLWGSRGGRRRLEQRLQQRWRNKAWELEELETGYLVRGLVCDEERLYCSFEGPRGFSIRVYHCISKVRRGH